MGAAMPLLNYTYENTGKTIQETTMGILLLCLCLLRLSISNHYNTIVMGFNGWTNYETWRVALEVFDNIETYDWDAEQCKEYLEDILEHSPNLALDYARAFINQVDYREIANKLNEH